MNIPLTPLRFKRRAVQLYGKKLGVICGALRFTYSEFGERCDRLSRALRVMNVKRGERVAFLAYNCHRLLEAYYGVVQMGGVLLPLNFRLSGDELTRILNDSEARVLFFDTDFAGSIEGMRPQLRTVERFIPLEAHAAAEWASELSYEDLLADAGPGPFAEEDPAEDDVAEVFYTSGTTGDPKGVMLTHRNLYLHALSSIIALGICDTDVQLHAIPLFHVNGWGAPQSLTCMGGTHVMMRRFDPAQVLQLLQSERVTYTSFVPTMAHVLVNHPAVSGFDFSQLRMILIGGAAPSVELVRQVEAKFGCPCYAGYGLTETSPILTISTPKSTVHNQGDEARFRRQSMTGWPLVGAEIGIVDEQGRRLEHDGSKVGEVIARSDGVMKGYWGRPAETDAVLRGGWFFTGDIGTIDEEEYLQVVDRKKDIIVSGGENIASIEIEQCLYAHADVLECAVVAIPDKKWGEVPVAFVVLKDGRQTAEKELLQFCRDSLAPYKCPKAVEFLAALPKGGTGKILKKELRRLVKDRDRAE